MKFLIKIEEAIDQMILTFVEKVKSLIPDFMNEAIDWIKHLPLTFKEKFPVYLQKIKTFLAHITGFIGQYTTMIKGHFVGVQIYLRSEEFKSKNKKDIILFPIKKLKTDPLKSTAFISLLVLLSFVGYTILTTTQKIIVGTNALRKPASMAIEEAIIEFKRLHFKAGEQSFTLNITLETKTLEERDSLQKKEKEIEEELLTIPVHAQQLPLTNDDIDAMKTAISEKLTKVSLKSISIKQVLGERPKYFLQIDKLFTMRDIDLQLFMEDTRRNRQVTVDFTALSSNRNIVLFLKKEEIALRDYLNTSIEPVIPQLPLEEEGRQIIKDKLRLEINTFLKQHGIEGSIQEIYVEYIMVS